MAVTSGFPFKNSKKDYQEANNSYVIFFCRFDPLGLGLQQYTIHRHVDESPEYIADDGTTTIFLNVPSLRKDVNQPLQKFLDMIANRKVDDDDDDHFIVQLKKRVAIIRNGGRNICIYRYMKWIVAMD